MTGEAFFFLNRKQVSFVWRARAGLMLQPKTLRILPTFRSGWLASWHLFFSFGAQIGDESWAPPYFTGIPQREALRSSNRWHTRSTARANVRPSSGSKPPSSSVQRSRCQPTAGAPLRVARFWGVLCVQFTRAAGPVDRGTFAASSTTSSSSSAAAAPVRLFLVSSRSSSRVAVASRTKKNTPQPRQQQPAGPRTRPSR